MSLHVEKKLDDSYIAGLLLNKHRYEDKKVKTLMAMK